MSVIPTHQFVASDVAPMAQLLALLRLAEPDTALHADMNEDGDAYAHLISPDGNINYFIAWTEGGAWGGDPQGHVGLPPVTGGPTAGAVALIVAAFVAKWFVGAAEAATSIIEGKAGSLLECSLKALW